MYGCTVYLNASYIYLAAAFIQNNLQMRKFTTNNWYKWFII